MSLNWLIAYLDILKLPNDLKIIFKICLILSLDEYFYGITERIEPVISCIFTLAKSGLIYDPDLTELARHFHLLFHILYYEVAKAVLEPESIVSIIF